MHRRALEELSLHMGHLLKWSNGTLTIDFTENVTLMGKLMIFLE